MHTHINIHIPITHKCYIYIYTYTCKLYDTIYNYIYNIDQVIQQRVGSGRPVLPGRPLRRGRLGTRGSAEGVRRAAQRAGAWDLKPLGPW